MPIATPDAYLAMLDRAKEGGFAYPSINVTSSQTLNAALQGFADAESDGIIQVSVGTALYLSGNHVQDRAIGSKALALYAHEVAAKYGVTVALHTDHCPAENLDDWVRPLIHDSIERRARGLEPLYQSHMWDGSAVTLDENLEVAKRLLDDSVKANTLLEIEVGVIGGEEDGVENEINDKLYSTVEDARATIAALGAGENGRYLTALTFGNVHGVYNPAAVNLRPEILGEIQSVIGSEVGRDKPFDLVFHGGSGSSRSDIAAAVANGVIKMNIDTDTQYAFTRSIAGHMISKYDQVLKIDGAFGNKKAYDPRSWGKPAEHAMAARVVEATEMLGSAGRSMGR
ncbi:class II fructose-bisphosphate aldolase [Subtercola boreus]|uniref:Fructose-bisphosphate aldolase n=1 Tax=Subtercola boreus TaxID=120213 RepID=A0A3E0W7J7_9MICO|nr:class II fructose-bisphosphate aldolase [Subtercola boreus]RFA18997.1 class II fructose-bisphosphate aldolase [Subtercola boreus]RFA19135.1 class II fructose-bisphosphate aldolase [Subtercola boreus]RFA25597.1 class II fructose-bisphosphate aldolase [Subtercola boreus]